MLVQIVRDGAIGKVKEAHTWTNRPIWPQGMKAPTGSDPVPSSFHWDLWLGTAPKRPYKQGAYCPFVWRGWYDFGAGALGDMGCHIIDPVYWSLGLSAPKSVRYRGPEPMPESFPEEETLTYTFAGTEYTAGDEIAVKWYDGGRKPPRDLAPMPKDQKLPNQGCMLVGTDGVLICPHGGGPQLLPRDKFSDYQRPRPGGRNHYAEWTDAIRNGGQPNSNFSYAGPLTEAVLLGVVASRVSGRTLHWDPANLRFTNSEQANQYVQEPYRSGFDVDMSLDA
jgi:predicted dehydrogenase